MSSFIPTSIGIVLYGSGERLPKLPSFGDNYIGYQIHLNSLTVTSAH